MTNRDMIIQLIQQFEFTAFTAQQVIDAIQNNDEMPEVAYEAMYDYYCRNNEMPYGTAKARDGDPYEWVYSRVADELGFPA